MRKLSAVLAALCLAVVPGTAHAADPVKDPARKVIKIGVTQSVDSMNPFLAVRLVTGSIQRMIYGFLTVPDSKTLQPSPDLDDVPGRADLDVQDPAGEVVGRSADHGR
jgi:peptide/nickel transport system substrate-binding protein